MRPSIYYTWTAEGTWKPLQRFAAICEEVNTVGEIVQLERVQQRSRISHDHFFACLHEAWMQLPELFEREFQNETKFRKWLLIEAGYCTEDRFQLPSSADAERFAACCAGMDEYARIDIAGQFVAIRKAESQSKKAMGNSRFQKSKQDVFDVYHKLTGIDPATLGRNAGKAA